MAVCGRIGDCLLDLVQFDKIPPAVDAWMGCSQPSECAVQLTAQDVQSYGPLGQFFCGA